MVKLTFEIMKLLSDSALKEMARVNNTTVDIASLAVSDCNEIACSQYMRLFNIGFVELNKLKA